MVAEAAPQDAQANRVREIVPMLAEDADDMGGVGGGGQDLEATRLELDRSQVAYLHVFSRGAHTGMALIHPLMQWRLGKEANFGF